MPDSHHSERQQVLQAWQQCRQQRWRLPLWLAGDPEFIQQQWHWLYEQLFNVTPATTHDAPAVFWLGAAPELTGLTPPATLTLMNGQARQQLLGRECEVLVVNACQGIDWDLVAASMGCLKAGGLWLLLTPEPASFSQQPNPAARRILSYPLDASQHVGNFQRYLVTCLQQQAVLCWQPGELRWGQPLSALPAIDDSAAAVPAPAPYASACQQQAVSAIWQVVKGHRNRPLVLTAHRGRGKSAALGIAAAQLQQAGKQRLIITAPQPAAAQVALNTAQQLLGEQAAALQFWPVDRLLAEKPPLDLLMIDEAAAIPAPQLQQLTDHYSRIVFATTEHGYEGTGRGFQLRFQQYLQQHRPGWRRLQLKQPVRYGVGDPLELSIFGCFLLCATVNELSDTVPADLAKVQYRRYQSADLQQQPALLKQIFALASLAHYQTSVRDLWAWLDDPDLQIFCLEAQQQVLAVAVVSTEGRLPAELSQQIYQGKRRVQGHLAAQSLIYHLQMPEFADNLLWRIQRLVVQPQLQQRGLGRHLLQQLAESASQQSVQLLCSSFGATASLLKFWQQAGYQPIRLSQKTEQSSNEHSVLVAMASDTAQQLLVAELQQQFQDELWSNRAHQWQQLDPVLLCRMLQPAHRPVSRLEQRQLQLFAAGQRDFPAVQYALTNWLAGHYPQLSPAEQVWWVRLCWQHWPVSVLSRQLNIPDAELLQKLRDRLPQTDLHQSCATPTAL